MHRMALLGRICILPLTVALATALTPTEATACGGFFCDAVQPIVQTAERILFRVNDDGTITTVVEVQYQGPPGNFAWVVPIPHTIDPSTIETVEPGFFDTLEQLTAPTFEQGYEGAGAGYAGESAGCSGPSPAWERPFDTQFDPPPDTSGVEVVGEAEVGPYEIEIITAEKGENLSNWLTLNGYQIGPAAADPMQHYIDAGNAFIGLKLAPDTPAGPIDALAFTYESPIPMVPIILTSVASASELEIIAYIAGRGRYAPGNYVDLDFDYQRVSFVGGGDTDYEDILRDDIREAGGQAWNTEFAQPLSYYPELHHAGLDELLPRELYLTRFHTYIEPEDMTADPWWQPSTLSDVHNHHYINGDGDLGGDSLPDPLAALWLFTPLWALRRRSTACD